MTKWMKKLTKKKRKHLSESGVRTLKHLKETIDHQETQEFPCWDCVAIGRKLGFKADLKAFHAANGRG